MLCSTLSSQCEPPSTGSGQASTALLRNQTPPCFISWIPAFAGMFMHLRAPSSMKKAVPKDLGAGFLYPPHPNPLPSGRGNFRGNDEDHTPRHSGQAMRDPESRSILLGPFLPPRLVPRAMGDSG